MQHLLGAYAANDSYATCLSNSIASAALTPSDITSAGASGASVFMADFEDANAPTWRNNVEGQLNVRDAVEGAISFEEAMRAHTASVLGLPEDANPLDW